METASRVTFILNPRVVVEFERYPYPTMLAIRYLQTFSVVFHVLRQNLTSKSPFLNFLHHSKHCDLPRACSP